MFTYVIIDDEEIIRKGTMKKAEVLSNILCCCGEAGDGKQALDLITRLEPDIIITDMQMPVVDGPTFLTKLTELFPEKPIVVISGYKEFEYMRSAISANVVDYLIKPFSKDMLKDALLKAVAKVQQRISKVQKQQVQIEQQEQIYYDLDIMQLHNQIFGLFAGERRPFQSKQLNFVNQMHNVVLVTAYSKCPIEIEVLRNYFTTAGLSDLSLVLRHQKQDCLNLILLFFPAHSLVNPLSASREIIKNLITVEPVLTKQTIFGISSVHTNINTLYDAFNECSEALNQHRVDGKEKKIFIFETSFPINNIVWKQQNQFLFRLETGKIAEISNMIDELFDMYIATPEFTIQDIKNHFVQLTDEVRIIMNTYYLQSHHKSNNIKNIFHLMFSIEELKEYYLTFFTQLSEILSPFSIYSKKNVVDQMKLYIDTNFDKNISIELLASLFYLNRSYLSSIFKASTGMTYIDYLNMVRLEHAKQLLIDTKLKMYQISKSVGYDNSKYFYRVFKKATGKTPEEYRNNSI